MKKFKLQLGDNMIFDNGESIQKKSFSFTGFSNGIHSFHRKVYEWTDEMLKDVGIIINRKEVNIVDDMGNCDSGSFEVDDVVMPEKLEYSSDGNAYYCIYDTEMGRGWCVLMKIDSNGTKQIIKQDHRDNVRDWMIEDWCKEMGVDVEITHER